MLMPRPSGLKNTLCMTTQERGKGKSEQFRFKDSTAAKVTIEACLVMTRT